MDQSVKCLPHRHEALSPGFVFHRQAGWLLFALKFEGGRDRQSPKFQENERHYLKNYGSQTRGTIGKFVFWPSD